MHNLKKKVITCLKSFDDRVAHQLEEETMMMKMKKMRKMKVKMNLMKMRMMKGAMMINQRKGVNAKQTNPANPV